MKQFLRIGAFLLALFGMSLRLHAWLFVESRREIGKDFCSVFDEELDKEFSKPSQWGYTLRHGFLIKESGLTYGFHIAIEFNDVKLTSIDDVEKLYVEIYKDFMKRVGEIRIIRPFLSEFPLTPATFQLSISFLEKDDSKLKPPFIFFANLENRTLGSREDVLEFGQHVRLKEGAACYSPQAICEKSAHDVPGLREYYSPSILRNTQSKKIEVPIPIEPSPLKTSSLLEVEFEFMQKFCNANGLHPVMIGNVGEHYRDSRHFEFALRGSQRLNIDEARKLGARCSQELFDFVCKDSRCVKYVKERSTRSREKHPSPTPIPEQLAFRISFWDESVDRPLAPYIAQIWLLDGMLKYYTADEGQCLVLVQEETFAEAQAFRKACESET